MLGFAAQGRDADRSRSLPNNPLVRAAAQGKGMCQLLPMAAHESPRTTKLYDRTKERLTQDEIERIVM